MPKAVEKPVEEVPVEESLPTGTFTIHLGTIQLESDDVEITGSIWAAVEVVGEMTSEPYWWEKEEQGEQCMDMDKIYTQLIDIPQKDEPGMFQYSQVSKEIVLKETRLTELVSTQLQISLYNGECRGQIEENVLLGVKTISLEELISNMGMEGMICFDPVETQPAYRMDTKVELDVALADYITGCRIMRMNHIEIVNIPPAWKPQLKEDEVIADVMSDPGRNIASYCANFLFLGDLELQKQFDNGKLIYVEPEAMQEEDNNSAPEGQWKIQWENISWTSFLTKSSIEQIQSLVDDGSAVEVNIARTVKDKNASPDDNWNALVSVNLTDLFSPGINTVTTSILLEAEIVPSREVLEERVKNSANSEEKKIAQAALDDYEARLTRSAGQAAVYVSAQTQFISVFQLNKPVIERPATPPKPLPSVAEVIPPREPLPAYPKRDACQELQKELQSIIVLMLCEYEKLFFGQEPQDDLPREEKKKKLVYHLNTEGIYHDFKENVKKKIVQVVREKFPKIAENNGEKATEPSFYGELFIFLMEQVSLAQNRIFTERDEVATVLLGRKEFNPLNVQTQDAILQVKANESEASGDFDRSQEFYLERIALMEDNAQSLGGYSIAPWYAYALFSFRVEKREQAAECLRQCLSIDSQNIQALHAYGALLCATGDYEQAEIMIKAALKHDTEAVQRKTEILERGHALLALYFDRSGAKANLTDYEMISAKNRSPSSNPSIGASWITLASYMARLKLTTLAQRAIEFADNNFKSTDHLSNEQRIIKRIVEATVLMENEEFEAAKQKVIQAIDIDNETANAWFLLGQINVREGKVSEAISSFSWALQYKSNLNDENLVSLYLQLGQLNIQASQLEVAKEVYLTASKDRPSCKTWLGVGIACFRLEEYSNAEQALAEANILDNTNPEVWGYLCLTCLAASSPHLDEAIICSEQALKNQLANATLLREMGNGFVSVDQLEQAEMLLRRSLALQPTSLTRRRLADVLSTQNCAEAALREYQTTLEESNDDNNEQERCDLLNKCSELLYALGRSEEAEEYKNMLRILDAQSKKPNETSSVIMEEEDRAPNLVSS